MRPWSRVGEGRRASRSRPQPRRHVGHPLADAEDPEGLGRARGRGEDALVRPRPRDGPRGCGQGSNEEEEEEQAPGHPLCSRQGDGKEGRLRWAPLSAEWWDDRHRSCEEGGVVVAAIEAAGEIEGLWWLVAPKPAGSKSVAARWCTVCEFLIWSLCASREELSVSGTQPLLLPGAAQELGCLCRTGCQSSPGLQCARHAEDSSFVAGNRVPWGGRRTLRAGGLAKAQEGYACN